MTSGRAVITDNAIETVEWFYSGRRNPDFTKVSKMFVFYKPKQRRQRVERGFAVFLGVQP